MVPSRRMVRSRYGTVCRSRERKFQEFSLHGTFAPGSESSKNFRSLEPSLPGTFAPGAKFQELSLPRQVTFGRDIRSWICTVCIRGRVRVLIFVVQRPIHIRRRPHNHHFQHATLVSLTTKLS